MLIKVPTNVGAGNLVPAGIYKVAFTGYKVRTSEAGNFCIAPEYTIQTQQAPDGSKVLGRKMFDNWTVTEASIGIWNNAYKALCGRDLPAGDFEVDEFANRVTSDCQGKEMLIQVEIKPDRNEVDRNVIKKYSAIGA